MMPAEMADATPRDPVKAAKKRAEKIRAGMRSYVQTLDVVREAWAARDWEPLGYESWDAYLDGEFGAMRLKLDVDKRRQAVEALRLAGMSTRAIGAAVGTSEATVRRDLDAAAPDDAPGRVTGADGKSYPAQQPEVKPDVASADQNASPGPAGEQKSERRSCEKCGDQLPHSEVAAGYRRCPDCDSDGDHVTGPDGRCRACNPQPGDCQDPWHSSPGEDPPTGPCPSCGDIAEPEPVSPAKDEWAPDPAGGGATTSATPGNPSAEAPGDADPEAEYRPWREHARGALGRIRHEIRDITGDLLDADMVAARADAPLLDDLEKLGEDLCHFVLRVRGLRAQPHTVWIARERKGIEYHRLLAFGMNSTACHRSTRTGSSEFTAEDVVERFDAKPCPRCWPDDTKDGA